MKNLRAVLCALTVLLMAAAVQAQETKVKANIPFDFMVGDRAYPAGEYSLKSVAGNGTVIEIASMEEGELAHVGSITCSSTTPAKKSKMVFHRVGENYYLYRVWIEGNLDGREFTKSRREVQLAKNHEKAELVIVAANISR